MVKEYVTVVSCGDGKAILQYNLNKSCIGCSDSSTCESYILNKIGQETKYQLELEITQTLIAGQRVELEMHETSLLYSATLAYFTTLLGLFIGSIIMQFFFFNQFVVFLGAVVGGNISFLIAQKIASYLKKKSIYQPTISQIYFLSDKLEDKR
ncbi:MAG: SoxR reducing system RseC family protein [Arsenophonus sp.]